MSERRKVSLRLFFIMLLLANVLFFAYSQLTPDSGTTAATRIEELQINPGRIKLMRAATRGPGGQAPQSACLEWGPFGAPDAVKAEAALGRLNLPRPAFQRPLGGSGVKRFAFFVREPDAAVVARIAELQRSFPGTQIKAGPCPG